MLQKREIIHDEYALRDVHTVFYVYVEQIMAQIQMTRVESLDMHSWLVIGVNHIIFLCRVLPATQSMHVRFFNYHSYKLL